MKKRSAGNDRKSEKREPIFSLPIVPGAPRYFTLSSPLFVSARARKRPLRRWQRSVWSHDKLPVGREKYEWRVPRNTKLPGKIVFISIYPKGQQKQSNHHRQERFTSRSPFRFKTQQSFLFNLAATGVSASTTFSFNWVCPVSMPETERLYQKWTSASRATVKFWGQAFSWTRTRIQTRRFGVPVRWKTLQVGVYCNYNN